MEQPKSTRPRLIPAIQMPTGAEAFSASVHQMLDGKQKDDAAVSGAFSGMDAMFDLIAAGMYNLASMLVGEGEQSVQLVETAVANVEFHNGESAQEARLSSRRALAAAAIRVLEERDSGCLAAPEGLQHVGGCIGDDDLDAAGVSRDEMERMFAGPERGRVREWLASLSTPMRVIFVLRAVAGLSATEIVALLSANAGMKAARWTADGVRELSRQALCSLASQLIHTATARD